MTTPAVTLGVTGQRSADGVVAYSDGNDEEEVYISPKGVTRISVTPSVHAIPVQMLAWITALTDAADAKRRAMLQELQKAP